MYEAHTWPHPCFRMITWQLLSRMMIAMDIIIYIDSICCCNRICKYTNFQLCCVISLLLLKAPMHGFTNTRIHQCTMYALCTMHYESPMHGFTNAQIHQCTDSPMHGFTNARIHKCTDSPMHGFTNARIHQCTDSPMHGFNNSRIHQCTDSPMHGFTNALCRDSPMHKFTKCTKQGFTNVQIHQCMDSPMHRSTNARPELWKTSSGICTPDTMKSTKVQTLGAYCMSCTESCVLCQYACAEVGHASRCSCNSCAVSSRSNTG